MSLPVLDLKHLELYTAGDAELEAELFGLFEQQVRACLVVLESDTHGVDWGVAAHTLKGAARGIGAVALGDACAAAEKAPTEPGRIEAIGEAAAAALELMRRRMADRAVG